MTYALGIDLGTTYTAAAIARGGRVEIVQLGTHGASIPSIVVLRQDDTVLTGEAAARRAAAEPDVVAREFKRRFGDSTPLLLGGRPQSPEAVTAHLLRSVVDHVTGLQGSAPDSVAITHPANWGPYKLDLLRQAVRMAGLGDATLLTEPEAAAIHYASEERIPDGAKVAVYDLGGGTFDAAVLQKEGDGFTILGPPEGIERLGGIDFDAAVMHHVSSHLDGALDDLEDDPVAASRLRDEVVSAKEALSSDTDATVPVLLPGLREDVRITRDEFENLIRPALNDTVAALRRALEAASVEPDDLHAVLLVGGSSRIPLVAEIVGRALERPVAVDSHPKHVVPLGAALVASGAPLGAPAPDAAPAPVVVPEPAGDELEPETDHEQVPVAAPTGVDTPPRLSRGVLIGIAAVVVTLLVIGGVSFLGGDGGGDVLAGGETSTTVVDQSTTTDDTGPDEGEDPSDDPTTTTTRRSSGTAGSTATTEADTTTTTAATTTTTAAATTTTRAPTTTTTAAPTTTTTTAPTTTTTAAPAGPVIGAYNCVAEPCIRMTSVSVDGGVLRITWQPVGFTPDTSATHAHFYWSRWTAAQAGSGGGGAWTLTANTNFTGTGETALANANGDDICVTVANGSHAVINGSNFQCASLP